MNAYLSCTKHTHTRKYQQQECVSVNYKLLSFIVFNYNFLYVLLGFSTKYILDDLNSHH